MSEKEKNRKPRYDYENKSDQAHGNVVVCPLVTADVRIQYLCHRAEI